MDVKQNTWCCHDSPKASQLQDVGLLQQNNSVDRSAWRPPAKAMSSKPAKDSLYKPKLPGQITDGI